MKRAVALAGILMPTAICAAAVLHVDDDASPGGDGQSWETAYRYLQDALAFAAIPANGVIEIRVAQGTYLPDRNEANPGGTGERAASFVLIDNVAIRGGYAGQGAADPDDRDIDAHETILSGDLAGDDGLIATDACCALHDTAGCNDAGCQSSVCGTAPACCSGIWDAYCVGVASFVCSITCPELEGNSYHVVNGSDSSLSAVLDGFTITAGNADVGTDNRGGGLYAATGSPSVVNCRFYRNLADNGGGIGVQEGDPIIEGCTFEENAAVQGGAVDIGGSNAAPLFLASSFEGNGGLLGGGLFNLFGTLSLSDCSFHGNRANIGGAIDDFGGSLALAGCAFTANFAKSSGGAVALSSAHLDLTRCRFMENLSTGSGSAGINVTGASNGAVVSSLFLGNSGANLGGAVSLSGLVPPGLQLVNCTIANNSANFGGGGVLISGDPVAIGNCIVWGNSAGGGAETDQIFVSASGELALSYSCVQGLPGTLGGFGNTGADPLFVDPDGADDVAGTGDDDLHLSAGSSSTNSGNGVAGVDIGETDLEGAPRVQGCHVDMGALESPFFVSDCNGNGEPDECDVAEGTSSDCNGNGRLDECDILVGLSEDCNANGFPDECDVEAALYRLDDGTQEQSIQAIGGDLIWFNQFAALRDGEVIVGVDICWSIVPVGEPTDIAIWTDPTNDGDPTDALLVTLVKDVPAVNPQTGLFNTIAVPPTPVGDAADVFYVGAHVSDSGGEAPACLDQTPPSQLRSWGVVGDNLEQLWNNVVPPELIDVACCPGNWMIRARRQGSADCNANGVPDECGSFADLDGDGTVDASDFAMLLADWGACQEACCPADLDNDGVVDVNDFLALLVNWD